MEFLDNLNRILEIIDYYFNFHSKITFEEKESFLSSIRSLISDFENSKYFYTEKNAEYRFIELTSIELMQFLFYGSLIILKSRSASSIRCYLPNELEQNIEVAKEFLSLLKEYVLLFNINIPENAPYSYFYFNDYTSIIRLLLYWGRPRNLTHKFEIKISELKLINFKFPFEKTQDIQKLFKKFEIFIYFNEKYMNSFFGEKGLLKRNKLSIPKFLESLSLSNQYTRQAVYKWKLKNYLPLSFLISLFNSNFEINKNFFENITFVQIGKMKNGIFKKELDEIKKSYDDWFIKFIQPPPHSELGYIFYDKIEIKETKLNLLNQFDKYLVKNNLQNNLQKYEKLIQVIKNQLRKKSNNIYINKLTVENFKSFNHFHISFRKGLNIIYGKNGSGKTTLLEAILFCFFHQISLRVEAIAWNLFDTTMIKSKENHCKVEIEIIKGDQNLKLCRKILKDGKQTFIISNGSELTKLSFNQNYCKLNGNIILKNSETAEKITDTKLSGLFYNPFDKYIGDLREIIIKELERYDIKLYLNDVFLSLFLEYYKYQYKIDEYYELIDYDLFGGDLEIKEFYLSQFNLNLFNNLISKLKNDVKELSKEVVENYMIFDKKDLLYNSLNNNDILSISLKEDKCALHKGVIENPGAVCHYCNSKYCENCASSLELCVKCDEVLLPDFIDFKRREYKIMDFMSLFNQFEYDISQTYLREYKISELKLILKDDIIIRTKLSLQNPFYDIILDMIEAILKRTKKEFTLKLHTFKRYLRKSRNFPIYKIISFYSLLIISEILNFKDYISSGNIENQAIIKEIIENLKQEVNINDKEFEKTILRSYPFEKRSLEFLAIFYILIQSDILFAFFGVNDLNDLTKISFEKLIKIIPPRFSVDNTLEQITIFEMFDNFKLMNDIAFEVYPLISPHRKDYTIFYMKLLNQLKLLKKVNMINDSYSKIKILEDQIEFIKRCRDFLYKRCLVYLNSEFKEKFKILFNNEKFKGFLDKNGVPYVNFESTVGDHPINRLSGGEKSKLLMLILSILIEFTNRNTFYLIDEPNELLDPSNINIMKQYFFEIFKNKQVIICTFIENYKEFQPAIVYHVLKSPTNNSYITQIPFSKDDIIVLKENINNLICKYSELTNQDDFENEIVQSMGFILDSSHELLERIGFKIESNGDTIRDNNFMIHLTRKNRTSDIHQFLIRKLDMGKIKTPDNVFFSMGYPDHQRTQNNKNILSQFITYLKKK